MSESAARKRLIVNADDFGRSPSINEAVIRAHREGILTTASLMVNEPGCEEAIALARENSGLGVGLHLTLTCGRSGMEPSRVPGLADAHGRFTENPVGAGMRYFLLPALRKQLEVEILEQFRRFKAANLKLDHVNGHLHMHLHPVVFSILEKHAARLGITHMRLTRDPLSLNLEVARGQLLYRLSHALIFGVLSARARARLARLGVRFTDRVFGLLQNARVDEDYLTGLLPKLPGGDSELYSHPCVKDFVPEFEALISPRVRMAVERAGIQLIRYQDL